MASSSKQYKAKAFHMWQRSGKELKYKNRCRGLHFFNSAFRQLFKTEARKEITLCM